MLRRILIIPDKFKGTLTAKAAAEAIARGWHKARPKDTLELLPMTDGGDGFGQVMRQLLNAKLQITRTVDAAGRPCLGRWWWARHSRTAIIESATVIGLALLPPKQFHPFALDTFGLGAVLRAALRKGARSCLIGIGGSATNDGGFGLARALGWRFFQRGGRPLERWTELATIDRLLPPAEPLAFKETRVAVDVANPLLGLRGATRIYGPQKGLRPQDFPKAEQCLRALARIVKRRSGRDLARIGGAGAAGGLGFGLLAFAGAKLEPGFDLFARQASLAERLDVCDLVITGEGAIDSSSMMGKGVGEIARRCKALGIPCIGLAGAVRNIPRAGGLFSRCCALLDVAPEKEALSQPAYWLEQLARQVATQS